MGDSSPLLEGPQLFRIHILPTVKAAFRGVFQDLQTFFYGSRGWITVIVILSVLSGGLVLMTDQVFWVLVIGYGSLLIAIPAFLVLWHRHTLLGEPVPKKGNIRFGAREIRFLIYSLAPVGVAVAGVLLIQYVGDTILRPRATAFTPGQGGMGLITAFAILVVVAVAYVNSRLSLFAPLAALDVPGNLLSASWRLTEGNAWRILISLSIVSLAFVIPNWLAISLLEEVQGWRMGGLSAFAVIILLTWVLLMIAFAQLACAAGILCNAFAAIMGRTLPLDPNDRGLFPAAPATNP